MGAEESRDLGHHYVHGRLASFIINAVYISLSVAFFEAKIFI
jgi:hypothetical protein